MNLLRQLLARKSTVLPPPVVEDYWLDDIAVSITFKRHATARRFTLRMAKSGFAFILTMPKRSGLADARRFVVKSDTWMRNVLLKAQPSVKIVEGAIIPLRGVPTKISLTNKTRGLVVHDAENHTLYVPGSAEHCQRRLTDWLKQEAKRDLEQASQTYSTSMGVSFKKLAIRDQKSRWGSCSSDGVLSYSWRLVLAEPYILDYVAAHEVAHLAEMNHGPRFWRLVLKHCPNTRQAQSWLKANSAKLHAIG
jgi:predicted metal-dependent hydrolase